MQFPHSVTALYPELHFTGKWKAIASLLVGGQPDNWQLPAVSYIVCQHYKLTEFGAYKTQRFVTLKDNHTQITTSRQFLRLYTGCWFSTESGIVERQLHTDHYITPVLAALYWLLVQHRVQYKSQSPK